VGSAQALVHASGWENVSVQQGRANATGLPEASFDCVMMRHVLAHNTADEQAIVDHLATLVKPGGCVYLIDADGHAIRLRPSDPDVDSLTQAYLGLLASRGNDFQSGLRLDQLLEGAGMELVTYRGWYNIVRPQGAVRPPAWAARDAMRAAGIATDEDIARWDAALTRLVSQRPTIFASIFGAVGRRPPGRSPL
jgi:SAM-dependent methyltransferase